MMNFALYFSALICTICWFVYRAFTGMNGWAATGLCILSLIGITVLAIALVFFTAQIGPRSGQDKYNNHNRSGT
jgi:hypothetical protein